MNVSRHLIRKPDFRSGHTFRAGYLMLFVLVTLILATGCWQQPQTRQDNLLAIAHWQDQRLAPQDSLSMMLTHEDAHVRLAAVRAAGLIGRNDVLQAMLGALQDPSFTVRKQAAFSLGILDDARALPDLERAAKDPRRTIRLAALSGLSRLSNDGKVLLDIGINGPADESAAAWDAIRNHVDTIDHQELIDAITTSMRRPEPDVKWRVLRCVERANDNSLVELVAPNLTAGDAQVRVHAYRALSRMDTLTALNVTFSGLRNEIPFRGRDKLRVETAACRTLGALGHNILEKYDALDPAIAADCDNLASLLIGYAGSGNFSVATTALNAMARCVLDLDLPAEAAAQESLLPVWRIRMARSARSHIVSQQVGVRAAAIGALAALRGTGSSEQLQQTLADEDSPTVLAATLTALSVYHPQPEELLVRYLSPVSNDRPELHNSLVREAALSGLALFLFENTTKQDNVAAKADYLAHLRQTLLDDDFVIATTAATLWGEHGTLFDFEIMDTAWQNNTGPERFDIQSGVLAGINTMLERCGAPDSLPGTQVAVVDSMSTGKDLLEIPRHIVGKAFDSTDIRIRNQARQIAVDSKILPAHLIPTEASLNATLPAVQRDPAQPAVTLSFAAPEVICQTNRGDFTIKLLTDIAPNTCAMFLDLQAKGVYDNLTFHRIVPDFVAQGGDPMGTGWGSAGYMIRCERSGTKYRRAMVGIADSGIDTGGCQFFVMLSEQPHLNGRYTLFAEVTDGMEIVDLLQVEDTFSLKLKP